MKKRRIIFLGLLLICLTGCGQGAGSDRIYEDVSQAVTEADGLYDAGDYTAGLEAYLDAMNANPKDTAARLGAVRCQIALGNMDIAQTDLSMLMKLDPQIVEIYDLYAQIGVATGNLTIASNAVTMARIHGVEGFLERVPSAPVFNVESGIYQDKLEIEIACDDPESVIYYNIYGDSGSQEGRLYDGPIALLSGHTYINAYTLKDGLPSESVSRDYDVDYAGEEIIFQDPYMEKMIRSALNKEEGPVTDLDCWNLTYLNLDIWDVLRDMNYEKYGDVRITTMEDLRYMPNLQGLDVYSDEEVSWNMAALSECVNLERLSLRYAGIKNLDFVRNMPNLRNLDVYGNEITDISILADCPVLDQLNVQDNPITAGLDEVLAKGKMEYLNMDDGQLTDYSSLEYCKKLRYLYIQGWDEIDRQAILRLGWLEGLSICMDWNDQVDRDQLELTDLSFVSGLEKLQSLHLEGVRDAEELRHLHGLKQLTYLYLYNCKVTEDKEAMRELGSALPNCEIGY